MNRCGTCFSYQLEINAGINLDQYASDSHNITLQSDQIVFSSGTQTTHRYLISFTHKTWDIMKEYNKWTQPQNNWYV